MPTAENLQAQVAALVALVPATITFSPTGWWMVWRGVQVVAQFLDSGEALAYHRARAAVVPLDT